MWIVKSNEPPAAVLWIFSIGIFCFEHKEIVLWKMGLNFFFCIKKFLHFRYNDSVTEWYANFFKLLFGFILIKSLQYWIHSCQFIVMCFDKLHHILTIFLGPNSFFFFILLLPIASLLGNVWRSKRCSGFYAESLAAFFFANKFPFLVFSWYLLNRFRIPLINKVITLFCCFNCLFFRFMYDTGIVIFIPTNVFVIYISDVMIWFRS